MNRAGIRQVPGEHKVRDYSMNARSMMQAPLESSIPLTGKSAEAGKGSTGRSEAIRFLITTVVILNARGIRAEKMLQFYFSTIIWGRRKNNINFPASGMKTHEKNRCTL